MMLSSYTGIALHTVFAKLGEKTCSVQVAYQFAKSYASCGHNGKKSCFYPKALKEEPKYCFSAPPSLGFAKF